MPLRTVCFSQVTHSITYLPEVDNIVVIKEGRISEVGTYKELLAQKGAFAEVLVQFLSQELEETDDDNIPSELEMLRWIPTASCLKECCLRSKLE